MAKAKEKPLDAAMRIVVLYGPEQMLLREKFTQLRDALAAEHGEVETVNFEGDTVELAVVLDELRSYGLMQQHKIIVVDAADKFVKSHREALERYAAQPVDTATLVLRGPQWNRGNIDKLINKVGAIVKCDTLKAPAAADWLVRRAASAHNRKLDKATANLLVQRLGTALGRLDTEFGKLAVLVGDGEPIDKELIDQVVGRGSDEQAWAVQEAVLQALTARGPHGGGNVIAALHEIIDLSGQPDILVVYFIADLMRKINLAAAMKKQGASDGEIGRAMKLWGPRQTLFMNLLRRIDERRAARLLDAVVSVDRRAKSGRGNATRNLEGFCAILTDEVS